MKPVRIALFASLLLLLAACSNDTVAPGALDKDVVVSESVSGEN